MISVKEASELTGFACKTIRTWCLRGWIKSERRAHPTAFAKVAYYVDKEEVQRWAANSAAGKSRGTKRPKASSVPNKILAGYIRPYLQQMDMGEIYNDNHPWGGSGEYGSITQARRFSACETLAEEAGLAISTVYKILNNPDRCSQFDTVDKLFTAMDRTHLWFTEDELRVYYEAA